MNNLALIIYCGLITFLTRFLMIAIIKKEMFNDRIRDVKKLKNNYEQVLTILNSLHLRSQKKKLQTCLMFNTKQHF